MVLYAASSQLWDSNVVHSCDLNDFLWPENGQTNNNDVIFPFVEYKLHL